MDLTVMKGPFIVILLHCPNKKDIDILLIFKT